MKQLNLISQMGDLLRSTDIPFWLRGGWAIDFLLGRVTRPHSDIDLVAWQRDAKQLRHLFEQAGFEFKRNSGIQYDFAKSEQEISVVFISQNGMQVCVEGIPKWKWLPKALIYKPQQLDGLICHVLSPEQLIEEKIGYENGTGTPIRAKDLHSIKILQSITTAMRLDRR